MTKKDIKQQLLDELYSYYKNCIRCPLGSLGRTQVVFGRGNADAKILLVGEAPGRDEDTQGLPFVGRSGKLLMRILAELEIDMSEIYITNVVKCRPPANRTPLPEESLACTNLLLKKQIKVIAPLLICTLGSCATNLLLNNVSAISGIRGKLQEYDGIPLMPTYHPAYILRNPSKLSPLVDDLEKAKEYIHSHTK